MRARTGRWNTVVAVATIAALVGARAQPAPAPAPAPAQGVQQAFDAAQTLMDARKFVAAEAAFAALETRLAASKRPTSRSLAVARLRHAQVLELMGDDARATALLLDAMPALSAPADVTLRGEALLSLGEAEERVLDLSAAAKHYRAALALLSPDAATDRLAIRIRLGRAAMFDDPAKAAGELKAGLAEARTLLVATKPVLAQYLAVYGRALLNAGQIKPARAAYREALSLSGGLSDRVHLSDLVLRGDAALAAELDHDHSEAAKLIAYTGAGQDAGVSLRLPPDVDPPACGEDIRPDDMAVVQFSLADDGSVSGAVPIYSAHPGPSAVAFARAVASWQWEPADAKAIKPFFRYVARLELRCTTRADRLSVSDLVKSEVNAWLAAEPSVHLPIVIDHTAADAATGTGADGSSPQKGRFTIWVPPGSPDAHQRRAMFDRGLAVATDRKAPPMVRAWMITRRDEIAIDNNYYSRKHRFAAESLALVTDAAFADAPRVRAWLAVVAAQAASDDRHLSQANALLGDVLAMPVATLAADDPIRRAAAIWRASLQTALGDRAAAVVTFSQSGVDPSQCALLDQTPVAVSRSSSSADYPQEALRMGFEGWAVTEFDITADGRTRSPRAVIVYPPFLFGASSAAIVSRSRYKPTFRPDGALSCGGYRDRVLYKTEYGR